MKRDRDQERKMRREMKEERERHHEKRQRVEKCLRTPQVRQTNDLMMIMKTSPLDELPVFSTSYMIRVRFFGLRELIQN